MCLSKINRNLVLIFNCCTVNAVARLQPLQLHGWCGALGKRAREGLLRAGQLLLMTCPRSLQQCVVVYICMLVRKSAEMTRDLLTQRRLSCPSARAKK